MIRSFIRTAIAGFLLAPFLILIIKLNSWSLPPSKELVAAFSFTFKQAALSSIGTLILGLLGGCALLHWSNNKKSLEFFLIVPAMLPTLFVILACFKVLSPFPFGLWGIVAIHIVMNTGLVSVTVAKLMRTKVSGWAELALVEGASKFKFLLVTVSFLKKDFALLFLFVFCLCFASLTVPLVAGRFDSLTTETLIYEKIKVTGEWGQALGLSILQSAIILAFTVFLSSDQPVWSQTRRNLSLLATPWGLVIPLVFSVLTIGSLLEGLPQGFSQIAENSHIQIAMLNSVTGTLVVGIGTAAFTLTLFLLVTYVTPQSAVIPLSEISHLGISTLKSP